MRFHLERLSVGLNILPLPQLRNLSAQFQKFYLIVLTQLFIFLSQSGQLICRIVALLAQLCNLLIQRRLLLLQRVRFGFANGTT